nr:integrase, catalytic region, zinc finger, CCHC-type, peptidase aspartic, catalytic [Tanacetum cinerariifolium]
MANLSEDIQCKENGVNILKSIDEGPYQMGIVREPLAKGTEGAPHLGPERPRVYYDLSPEEKDRYNVDIQATNILVQGLPKDIYTLINHYTDAKDIWDNVKMLLEGSKLTKEDQESQLNIKMTMSRMQLNSKFVKNMLPEWGRFVTTGRGATGYGGVQNRVGNANPGQARQVKCYNCNDAGHIARNCTQPKRPQSSEYYKDKMMLMQAQENEVTLDAKQLLFLACGHNNAFDDDVDEQPVQDLALNMDNVFQADDCNAFDSNVDEAPMAQTMFMANLSSADPVTDEVGPSYDSDILFEVQDHDHYQDAICAHHEDHSMHDSYVKDNEVPVVHSNVSSVPNDAFMMIYNNMYEPYAQSVSNTSRNTVVENSLTAELATYKEQVELFGNNPPTPDKDTPDFDLVFVIGKMKASLQGKDNVIRQLKKQISQLQETRSDTDRTLKHHKELYDSIKITCAKHIEQVTALTIENVNIKAQILEKVNSVSKDKVKPKVLRRGKHAIDVEPIVPRLRNNRDAHLGYLRHLKESVETIRDIVEETNVVRPLDRSIVSACRYTKHSQELLEYAIGTCPQDSLQRDKKLANIPLIRKKQVTFANLSDTSNSNTHKPVAKVHTQKNNVPVPHSTRVKRCTNASGSQPRSNTKKNSISPAKGVNKLPVEEQSRTNKSLLRTSNRVDSSSCIKRTVVQIVLWYLDLGCSKHMTRDRSRLMNFMKKFIGTVRFGNDHFAATMGYEDYVIGDNVISRNVVVKRQNRTLVEAAQMMLIFSKASIEDLGKLQPTADIGIFVGYAPSRKGYKIYNKRTRRIMETIHVQFDELTKQMAPVHLSIGPAPNLLTPGHITSGLIPNPAPASPYVPPTNKDLEILFQPMFDEYLEPPRVERPVYPAQEVQAPVNSADTSSSTTIDQDAPL